MLSEYVNLGCWKLFSQVPIIRLEKNKYWHFHLSKKKCYTCFLAESLAMSWIIATYYHLTAKYSVLEQKLPISRKPLLSIQSHAFNGQKSVEIKSVPLIPLVLKSFIYLSHLLTFFLWVESISGTVTHSSRIITSWLIDHTVKQGRKLPLGNPTKEGVFPYQGNPLDPLLSKPPSQWP